MPEKTINHFMFLKFTDAFWAAPAGQRSQYFTELSQELEAGGGCAYFYQVSPLMAGIDFMVWNAAPLESETDESVFFERLARVLHARRVQMTPVTSLWGYTRPSVYSRAPSPQEMDPFAAQRQPYLVLVPFCQDDPMVFIG